MLLWSIGHHIYYTKKSPGIKAPEGLFRSPGPFGGAGELFFCAGVIKTVDIRNAGWYNLLCTLTSEVFKMYEEPKIEVEELEVADVISTGDPDNSDFDGEWA